MNVDIVGEIPANPFHPNPLIVNAEWGSFRCTTWMEFIEVCAAQLQFHVDNDRTQNRAYTIRDLTAYREILAVATSGMPLSSLGLSVCSRILAPLRKISR